MGLGAFMAGAGTAIASAQNWQQQQQEMQNRATLIDLEQQRMKLAQDAWNLRKAEEEIRLRALQQQESDMARQRAHRDEAGAPPWPGAGALPAAGAPPAAGGLPVVVPGGAAGAMRAAVAGVPPGGMTPPAGGPPPFVPSATPTMTPAPAASPVQPTSLAAATTSPWADEGYAKRRYDLAVKNKQWAEVDAIRQGFVEARRAQVLNGLWQAYSAAKATGSPRALIALYNALIPDGREAKDAGMDPATGKHFIEFSTGEKVALNLDEMGQAIHRLTNSEEGAKLFGKVLEERVKGEESRKTESQKATAASALQTQKDTAAGKRTATTAAATRYAAEQGYAGRKYAADKGATSRVEAARLRGSKGGLDPVKQAKEATVLVYKSHGASELSGIDPNAQPAASAQAKRAEQLALAGWPAGAASDKALQEWRAAEAAAEVVKGKPVMPTDVPPPPYGIAATDTIGVPDKFTADDEDEED